MNKGLPLIHINGLGRSHNKIVKLINNHLWKRTGFDYTPIDVNWFSGQLDNDTATILKQAKTLLRKKGRLVIMGSSAGGSLAAIVFNALSNSGENVAFVNDRGRLYVGDPAELDERARGSKLLGRTFSEKFITSVNRAENVVKGFSDQQKKRILVLQSSHDKVVKPNLQYIQGAAVCSRPLGHSSGYFAHILFARREVMNFFNRVTN